MREHQNELERLGARIAAIGLGDRNYARLFREETGITFPLLIDEYRMAYRAAGLQKANILHLFLSENKSARERARLRGHQQVKLGKNPFQLGGSFIFAPGNFELYAHISRTFGDTAPVAELLTTLREDGFRAAARPASP